MTGTWKIWCLAFALSMAGSLYAAEKAPKLEWNGKKGDAAMFTVKRSSASEGQGAQGEFRSNDETEIQYRVEVSDRKDAGDFELKVTYGSVKAKQEGGDRKFEFDSAKKEGGDEDTTALREAMAKRITVKVSGGKIGEISGFPEVARPEGGQRDFRAMRTRSIVSRRTLQGDLDLILARAVQGQTLESGKEYRAAREERETPEGGKGRGRSGFGFEPIVVFKYQGEEKVGDQAAAKFALSTDAPQSPAGGGPAMERKSEGTALVSLKDGVLLKLELKTQGKSEGERNGQTFKMSRASKTSIERGECKPEVKPKEATV